MKHSNTINDYRLKGAGDKGSECAECGLKCCICCFWFLEKFLRYLNHNAYTVIGTFIAEKLYNLVHNHY